MLSALSAAGEQIISIVKGVLGVIGGESPANDDSFILVWLVLVELEKCLGLMSKASLSCQIMRGVSSVVISWFACMLKMLPSVPDGTFPALLTK